MRRLVKKLLLFSIPVWMIILSFFVWDPFKIICHYDNLSEYYQMDINRDFVATEVYKHNNPKLHYNSFIFGSSRTLALRTASWKKHLENTSVPYLYNSSNDGLFGILGKMKFLVNSGAEVKNVLFLLDTEVLSGVMNVTEPMTIKHYQVSGESRFKFTWVHLKKYISNLFWFDYMKVKLFGAANPYYTGDNIRYDSITNDWNMYGWEKQIAENSDKYYHDKIKEFYRYGDSTKVVQESSCIMEIQKQMLREIYSLLMKCGSDYRIVISPMYHQKEFNKNDLLFLKSLFGGDRVFDFSGINDITNYRQNYYEARHFRPSVGDTILNRIYRRKL